LTLQRMSAFRTAPRGGITLMFELASDSIFVPS
jgi:hypothetical protein